MASVIRGSDNFDSLASSGLGDGQTWQDVTASRSSGITYTNTTGKAIGLSISGSGTTNSNFSITINGIIFNNLFGTFNLANVYVRDSISIIIPNGATYSITSLGISISNWLELR